MLSHLSEQQQKSLRDRAFSWDATFEEQLHANSASIHDFIPHINVSTGGNNDGVIPTSSGNKSNKRKQSEVSAETTLKENLATVSSSLSVNANSGSGTLEGALPLNTTGIKLSESSVLNNTGNGNNNLSNKGVPITNSPYFHSQPVNASLLNLTSNSGNNNNAGPLSLQSPLSNKNQEDLMALQRLKLASFGSPMSVDHTNSERNNVNPNNSLGSGSNPNSSFVARGSNQVPLGQYNRLNINRMPPSHNYNSLNGSSSGNVNGGVNPGFSSTNSNGIATMSMHPSSQQQQQPPVAATTAVANGTIIPYTREERLLRIARYLEKKQRRVWKKNVKYDCRKRLAEGRPRVKGRFVSHRSTTPVEDAASTEGEKATNPATVVGASTTPVVDSETSAKPEEKSETGVVDLTAAATETGSQANDCMSPAVVVGTPAKNGDRSPKPSEPANSTNVQSPSMSPVASSGAVSTSATASPSKSGDAVESKVKQDSDISEPISVQPSPVKAAYTPNMSSNIITPDVDASDANSVKNISKKTPKSGDSSVKTKKSASKVMLDSEGNPVPAAASTPKKSATPKVPKPKKEKEPKALSEKKLKKLQAQAAASTSADLLINQPNSNLQVDHPAGVPNFIDDDFDDMLFKIDDDDLDLLELQQNLIAINSLEDHALNVGTIGAAVDSKVEKKTRKPYKKKEKDNNGNPIKQESAASKKNKSIIH